MDSMPSPQTKRSADCMAPLQERPGKISKVVAHDDIIELTISYAASGKKIVQLKISKESSVADLKKSVKEHLQSGTVVQALLKGDAVLHEHTSLGAIGVENGAEVKAIIGSQPTLFLANPSNAGQDFGSDDEASDDECGSDDEAEGACNNNDISKAPEVALEVAKAMMAAAPDLGRFPGLVGGDESCSGGAQVIVIAHPGDDAKMACLKALKTPKYNEMLEDSFGGSDDENDADPDMPRVWRCAEIEQKDWKKHLESGFNNSSADNAQILAITKVMSESLEKHFSFGFTDDLVCAPQVWGGYASDGSIVGVKAFRVWT